MRIAIYNALIVDPGLLSKTIAVTWQSPSTRAQHLRGSLTVAYNSKIRTFSEPKLHFRGEVCFCMDVYASPSNTKHGSVFCGNLYRTEIQFDLFS